MNTLRIVMTIIALLIAGAHYGRAGDTILKYLFVALPLLLLVRKKWSDGKIQRVENFLTDFAINAVKVADIRRSDRIEREEQWRQQEEERRRQDEMNRLRQIEEERLRDLENQTDRWFKSNQLREYISAVENAASERGISINDEPLKRWLQWAKNHANRFDPLYNNLPFENKT